MSRPRFSHENLREIITALGPLAERTQQDEYLEFDVPDPDRGAGLYAGEILADQGGRHRSFRSWLELGEHWNFRMCTPQRLGDGWVRMRMQKRRSARGLTPAGVPDSERYGRDSEFYRIAKLEEPRFALDYATALDRIALRPGMRVLCPGVHRGDELAPLVDRLAIAGIEDFEIWGIDHCQSALHDASLRFGGGRFRWICADLADWASLGLPTFNLVTSIGTLQSPGVDGKTMLPKLLRDHGTLDCAVILGLPNSRYVGGDLDYGARMLNFSHEELSLVAQDAVYFRKLLSRRRLHVTVTGKYYMFVTGVAWGSVPAGAASGGPGAMGLRGRA